MKDTSLKNTLFQAEFNTDLQLADVMRFISERYDLKELLRTIGFTQSQLVDYIHESRLDDKVVEEMLLRGHIHLWDFIHHFSTEALEDEVRERHMGGR